MTIKRTIKKTVRKSTSSHSSKVAKKSVKAKALKLPLALQRNYYSEKTLVEVHAVGKGFIKAHETFEKKSVTQKIELIKLTAQMIVEAKKNKLELNKDTLRDALYHFTGYDKSKQLHSFVVAIKRIINNAFELLDDKKNSIDEKTGQILDKDKKVISAKKQDAKYKGTSRNRDNKKNEVATLSKARESLEYLNNNPQFLQNLDLDDLTDFLNTLESVVNSRTVEAKEDPNPQMKNVGVATLSKNAFANKSARQ
jgi:hypothetical protein